MRLSNRNYGLVTKLIAIVAAGCAFALGRPNVPYHTLLMVVMICSALTSACLMFFTTEAANDGMTIAQSKTTEQPQPQSGHSAVQHIYEDVLNASISTDVGKHFSAAEISISSDASTKLISNFFFRSIDRSSYLLETNANRYWGLRQARLDEILVWECEQELSEQKKMLDAALYILDHSRNKDLELVLTPKNELLIHVTSHDSAIDSSQKVEFSASNELPHGEKAQYVN